jgi:hypothetical protein
LRESGRRAEEQASVQASGGAAWAAQPYHTRNSSGERTDGSAWPPNTSLADDPTQDHFVLPASLRAERGALVVELGGPRRRQRFELPQGRLLVLGSGRGADVRVMTAR